MTSIEWLIDQLIPEDQHEGIMDIIEDAKDRHKQEIIDAHDMGCVDGAYQGAKWQEERMHSEEEVYNLLLSIPNFYKLSIPKQQQAIKEWFKQFKKK